MSMLKDTFGADKPIIGMIHLGALPGSPLHDKKSGMAKLIDEAAGDIEALQKGGVDAVMFGNENDRPYLRGIAGGAGSLRLRGRTTQADDPPAIRRELSVGPRRDGGAGHRQRRGSAREIFTGVHESDMGLWPRCRQCLAVARRWRTSRPQAPVQHQCRIRLAARQPLHRAAGAQCRLLLWPMSSWSPVR